jgi:uncharacterized protein (DUF427 family)
VESVWDYPRPPAVVACQRRVRVAFAEQSIADSTNALRVLETASPPTIYVPAADVRTDLLIPVQGSTVCEWKGVATYFDVAADGEQSSRAAWSYPELPAAYAALVDHYAFYPGRVECHLDEERVRPQVGGFYGGWVTDDIAGPFKGEPGTGHW